MFDTVVLACVVLSNKQTRDRIQEIDREEFRRELLKATGRKISEQEMDVICRGGSPTL
jgi:hypothetical protein